MTIPIWVLVLFLWSILGLWFSVKAVKTRGYQKLKFGALMSITVVAGPIFWCMMAYWAAQDLLKKD